MEVALKVFIDVIYIYPCVILLFSALLYTFSFLLYVPTKKTVYNFDKMQICDSEGFHLFTLQSGKLKVRKSASSEKLETPSLFIIYPHIRPFGFFAPAVPAYIFRRKREGERTERVNASLRICRAIYTLRGRRVENQLPRTRRRIFLRIIRSSG